MGIYNLSWVCLAVFSVSALAADPPVPRGNVSATVNPTTGYYSSTNSTVRLPSGVSTAPSSASLPVVSKYSGGMQQTIPTGITIDAIKKSAPLPAVVRATTQSVKNAATGCLKSARCNVGLMLAGEGLNRLFNTLDWVMGEGGAIQKSIVDYSVSSPPSSFHVYTGTYCLDGSLPSGAVTVGGAPCASGVSRSCWPKDSTYTAFAGVRGGTCYWVHPSQPVPDFPSQLEPVSNSDIESAVESDYSPEPSDWPALTPELELDDVEITWAPTLESNPKTTTIYDAAGNPVEVQETNIWYDFDIRDNPSPSPALDLKTRQETKTYKNGQLTGTTTTTDTDSAGTAAGGGGSSVDIDIPTDCEFMPTVCAFLDWFKNDDTPEDPDLSALIDNRDFTETYSITGGSKQCPADYEFTVDFIGRTYGLSFEPACDFASKMYYFVMAAAYIFAAYITIGASRNG